MTTARRGVDGFTDDLAMFSRSTRPRVPWSCRLLEELASLIGGDDPSDEGRAIAARFAGLWRERHFNAWFDRPLLVLAALRGDAFVKGPRHPLWRAVAAESPEEGAVTRRAIVASMAPSRHRFWQAIATQHVQTNETSRAVAWLWPAHLVGASNGARPIALVDVACSAGLNLVGDALAAPWTDVGGSSIPVAHDVRAVARLGLDARPLEAGDPEEAQWLRACVWAGETARIARLDAALAAMQQFRARGEALTVETCDAVDAPARIARLQRELPAGTLVLAYQSHARDYFPPAVRERYLAGMRAWLAAAPATSALWIELEPDGAPDAGAAAATHPAALTAHLAGPDAASLRLARSGHHPSILAVDEGAARALAARFGQLL